jgi:hypothetical protein
MTATVATLWSDPLYAQMESMKIAWGDLVEDAPAVRRHASDEDDTDKPTVLEYGWDFEYPALTRREHIWNNFPYDVVPLGRGADGADRHAVRLNRTKFDDWRNTRTADFDEAMDYADITEHRLLTCLTASTYWTVEEPITDKDLCVIRMNFAPRTEAEEFAVAPKPATPAKEEEEPVVLAEDLDEWVMAGVKKAVAVAPAAKPTAVKPASVPLIASKQPLKELATHFPVCWNKEAVATRTAVYSLSIHGTNARNLARDAGRDAKEFRAEMEVRLMATLKASPAWRVLRAENPTEFCRLEMA